MAHGIGGFLAEPGVPTQTSIITLLKLLLISQQNRNLTQIANLKHVLVLQQP